MTVGFLALASAIASSRVAGSVGRKLGCSSFAGAWPTARSKLARLTCKFPSACWRDAVAPASLASAWATSVRVTAPTRN